MTDNNFKISIVASAGIKRVWKKFLTNNDLRGKIGEGSSRSGETNMRPAKEFRGAREAFRRDQQS